MPKADRKPSGAVDVKSALRSAVRAGKEDRFDDAAAVLLTQRERSGIIELDISLVQPNPNQPRQVFDEEKLRELAASIRVLGVLQPILIRKTPDGTHHIVAGERRWRASKMAGLSTIPVTISILEDNESLEASLTENLQRADLTPLEEGHVFLRMLNDLGYSIRRLADRLGKGKGYIEDRVRIARMDPTLQELVSGRPDTLTHAREIERVADETLRKKLIEEVRSGRSVQDIRRKIERAASRPAAQVLQIEQPSSGDIPHPEGGSHGPINAADGQTTPDSGDLTVAAEDPSIASYADLIDALRTARVAVVAAELPESGTACEALLFELESLRAALQSPLSVLRRRARLPEA